jgi:hypothetical protein
MKSTYYADYGIINLLLQNTLYGYWLLMGYGDRQSRIGDAPALPLSLVPGYRRGTMRLPLECYSELAAQVFP